MSCDKSKMVPAKLTCICYSGAADGPRIVVAESTNLPECLPGDKLTVEQVKSFHERGVNVTLKRK